MKRDLSRLKWGSGLFGVGDGWQRDLVAGLTVAVMVIPQGMAYALLAGLPPQYGLYASTFPLLAYSLVGSSPHLAVGPVAIMSLVVMETCSPLAVPGEAEFISLALLLALMIGVLQLVLGLLRFGVLTNFMSRAVIRGFSTGAALLILMSQVHPFLGISPPSGVGPWRGLLGLFMGTGQIHPLTLFVGAMSILVLVYGKRSRPSWPWHLMVVTGAVLVVSLPGLEDMGVRTLGEIPSGLPAFSFPLARAAESWRALLPGALVLVFVGYMESMAVAQIMGDRSGYRVDPDRELIGLGAANIVGSFLSAYPVTGGFSRTAVNFEAGARSRRASMFTALFVLVALAFFTPLFRSLPRTVLAAVVIQAVFPLVDFQEFRILYRLCRGDGISFLVAFLGTLLLGVEWGLLAGIAVSLGQFLWRSAHPRAVELGYVEEEGLFRGLDRFPQGGEFPETLLIRVDASLYFANMDFLVSFIRDRVLNRPGLKWLLLDCSSVNGMDGVALRTIEGLIVSYRERGIRIVLAGMKAPLREMTDRAGWPRKFGGEVVSSSLERALSERDLW